MADFQAIVDKTFKFEGGFQNYATDSANYSCGNLIGTNRGISAIALQTYYGRCVNEADVRAITHDLAVKIYKQNYWDKVRGDDIKNQSVAHLVFDSYIGNPTTSKRMVQQTLSDLGKDITVKTPYPDAVVEAINDCNSRKFFETFWDIRKKEFERICKFKPEFCNGWMNRLNKITYEGSSASDFLRNKYTIAGIGLTATAVVAFFAFKYFRK